MASGGVTATGPGLNLDGASTGSRDPARALADYRLDDLRLDPADKGLRNVQIGGVLTDGSLSLTINGASTIEINLQDTDKNLLRGDFLTRWTWGRNADHTDEAAWVRDGRKIDIELDDLTFRLARLAKGPARSLVLTFEELSVAKLREKRGARSAVRQTVGRTGVTRAQFVKMLADEAKVPTHIPELRDPQRILPAQGLTPTTRPRPARGTGKKATPTQRQRSARAQRGISRRAGLTVKGQRATSENYRVAQIGLDEAAALHAPRNAAIALIAAYIAENNMTNHPGGGGGSSGSLQLIPSTAHSLGVSPLNIKGCARLFLKRGFWGKGGAIRLGRRGMAPADIAHAVQGNRDGASSYSPFVHEAQRWVNAYSPTGSRGGALGIGGIGLPAVGPTSVTIEKPYSFSRGANETSWDAIQRLAEEVQWRAFVRKGVLWYISDDALRQQAAALTAWETREHRESPVSEITHVIDLGARNLTADLTITATASRWVALPGMKVLVEEEGPANGAWLVNEVSRPLWDKTATISCAKPIRKKAEPAPDTQTITFGGTPLSGGKGGKALGPSVARGGARAIVEAAASLARQVGGGKVYVSSAYRPGASTATGPSDHSSNDSRRAARDIAHRGTDANVGPPTRDLDKACVAIGAAFGRNYRLGATVDADTFHWHGFRIQIIWRTPKYGGHMGHVHVGARKA